VTRTERNIVQSRKGDACIPVRDAAGRPCPGVCVSVEQEGHAFLFGCVAPEQSAWSEDDRSSYQARLSEVFNRVVPAEPALADAGVCRVDVPQRIHLGLLRRQIDRCAAAGVPLHVHVGGAAVGMNDSDADERTVGRRVAELYTLCFAHPAVTGIWWHDFADGEPGGWGGGLLRCDLAPKHAHKMLQKLIGCCWHSRAAGVTDADGSFRFRGFFGDYRVVAQAGDPAALVRSFTLQWPKAHATMS